MKANCLRTLCVLTIMMTGCQAGRNTWPQWGGPNRDFTLPARPLHTDWESSEPKKLWERTIGPGYSTVAGNGKHVFTTYRNESSMEVVLALNPANGRIGWKYEYECPLIDEGEGEGKKRHDLQFGTPPQSTPLIVGNSVYTFGFCGKLICFESSTGKIRWEHDLYEDFGANFNRFGYATSPIAYRNMIILPVGGSNDQGTFNGITAFDRTTGKVRWQSTEYDTVWSSPILVNLEGEDLLFTYMQGQLLALSPADGQVRWRYESEGKFDESIMTPIWCPENRMFCRLGGDDKGAALFRFSRNNGEIGARRLWLTEKVQGSLSNPVLIGNTFYGASGGKGMLAAWDINSGDVLWKERSFPRASLIAVGDRLIILDEEGNLSIAAPNAESLNVQASFKPLENPAWAAPSLVGETLYMRDNKKIVAYDLSPA